LTAGTQYRIKKGVKGTNFFANSDLYIVVTVKGVVTIH